MPLGRRPRDNRLHAAGLSAITGPAGFIQEIMAPFPADPMTPAPDLSVYDHSPANPGPHNDAKYHPRAGPFRADNPPLGLRQCKTVGIIGQHDRNTEPGSQII